MSSFWRLAAATVVVSFLGGMAYGTYYYGSKCQGDDAGEQEAKCQDCLAGRRYLPSECPQMPHQMCVLVQQAGNDNAQFTHCIKSSDSQDQCETQVLEEPVATCSEMKVWWCGCYDPKKHKCSVKACSCGLTPNETHRTHEVNATCTDDNA